MIMRKAHYWSMMERVILVQVAEMGLNYSIIIPLIINPRAAGFFIEEAPVLVWNYL